MKKVIYTLFIVTLSLACSGKDNDVSNETNALSKCLMSKDYKYEDLLTKADIAKHVTIEESSYKIDISSIKGDYGSCKHEWASDRPDLEMELLGQLIKYPDMNRVTLKGLHFYSEAEIKLYNQSSALTLFNQTYEKLSQEEYNRLLANIEKEYANDPNGLATAKKFFDARMEFTYQPISNLADMAYWKWHAEYGIELVVLVGTAHFTVESKTSADKNTALDHAIKFAEEVLKKCEK